MSYTSEHAETEPSREEIDRHAGLLVLEFGAPWCGHCQAIQATLAGLLANHPEVAHLKIYDGRGRPLGRSFRVKLWPTLVFLRDGKVVSRIVRPADEEIAESLQALLVPLP